MKFGHTGFISLLMIVGASSFAEAQVDFTARYYPFTSFGLPECHTKTSGSNTAGSFAAAGMMGAEGFSDYMPPNNCAHGTFPDWEDNIINLCQTATSNWTALNGLPHTIWPSSCNPAGMATALNASPFPVVDWVMDALVSNNLANPNADTNRTAALNTIIGGLQSSVLRSPAVVPMFGQGDHWVTIVHINATQTAVNNTGGSWNINFVKYIDGGPAATGMMDGGFNPFPGSGLQIYGGNTFVQSYFRVVNNIVPNCSTNPSCTSDFFYNKWVWLYEPPAGVTVPAVTTSFARSPSISRTMNEHLAQQLVWASLFFAGIVSDSEVWSAIKDGVAGHASLVKAMFPTGAPWNYYLVPIMENSTSSNAIALVQLDAADGSFQGIHLLSAPTLFAPVTQVEAGDIARGTLAAGESLSGSVLTWDPASKSKFNRSATQPYYEFRVTNTAASNQDAGMVRVMLHGGAVERISQ